MNKLTQALSLLLMIGITNCWASTPPVSKAITQEKQASLTPQRALEMLKEGNQRFLKNEMRNYNFSKEMKTTSTQGQFPLGVILSCMDSRSIPDLLFDQGIGNLFVSRIAGNVADKDLLGSMEFATKLAGSRLVLVMGHTHCGAIRGACVMQKSTDLKNLDFLLGKIKTAVNKLNHPDQPINCQEDSVIDQIAKQNVVDQMQYIMANSSAINKMVSDKNILLVGAMHDIKTGKVDFFDMNGNSM